MYNTPTINVSNSYEKFHHLPQNRPQGHWQRIVKSLRTKNLSAYTPIVIIVISDKWYILDGGNRYEALKFLGLPIYYVIASEGAPQDLKLFNVFQQGWKISDFFHFYVAEGYASYLLVKKVLDSFPNLLLGYVLNIYQSHAGGALNANEAFREGTYNFTKEAFDKCGRVSTILTTFENAWKGQQQKGRKTIPAKDALVSAISSYVGSPKFQDARLLEQIQKFPHKVGYRADQKGYREHIEELYNISAHANMRVFFPELERKYANAA